MKGRDLFAVLKWRRFLPVVLLALAGGSTAARSAPVAPVQPPHVRLREGLAYNWAGYAIETNLQSPTSDVVSDVKGQWVVPTLACAHVKGNSFSSAWVGIDGYANGTVEQIGTEHDCLHGAPRYYAWFEMYPYPPVPILSLPMHAGDIVQAEVQYLGNGQFRLTLQNQTTGDSYDTTQALATALRQSAEWIVEDPGFGKGTKLADFGTVSFVGAQATLSGHTGTINDSQWQYDRITMVRPDGRIRAQPSALSSGGDAFSVTWSHE